MDRQEIFKTSYKGLMWPNYDTKELSVHESMHRDTTMKITNKMHCID
jgi:hypothetical protein